MSDRPRGLEYAVPSAVAGGIVYAALSFVMEGRVDFLGGAIFMLVFGLVVTVGLVYADRSEDDGGGGEDEPGEDDGHG